MTGLLIEQRMVQKIRVISVGARCLYARKQVSDEGMTIPGLLICDLLFVVYFCYFE
jgi:hypothetical protein